MIILPHNIKRSPRRFNLLEQNVVTNYTSFIQAATSTSLTLTTTNNITAGNVLIVGVGWESSNNIPTISDTRGTTYKLVKFVAGVSSTYSALFVGIINSTGTCTITISISGSPAFNHSIAVEMTNLCGLVQNVNTASLVSGPPICLINGIGYVFAWCNGFHNVATFNANYPLYILSQVSGNDAGAIMFEESIYSGGGNTSRTITYTGNGVTDQWIIIAMIII